MEGLLKETLIPLSWHSKDSLLIAKALVKRCGTIEAVNEEIRKAASCKG